MCVTTVQNQPDKVTYDRIDFRKYCVISVWFGCNNNCGICMLSKSKSDLPAIGFEQYKNVINKIKKDGRFENLILSGAEVTTFDALDKYVECAASLGWFKKIQIQTNGRRLSDRPYLDHLIDRGVNEFFVSIHGFEATHDRATGIQGAFKEVREGLRNLSERSANVISNTVLTKDNLPEIEELVQFLCGECVNEIHLWNYFPMDPEDGKDLLVRFTDLKLLLPGLKRTVQAAGKVMVLKSFPLCLFTGAPVFFDSVFPEPVLPDLFWKEFAKCGFGKCIYRGNGTCKAAECWGLSEAYRSKYGDEKTILKPVKRALTAGQAPVEDIQRRTAIEFEGQIGQIEGLSVGVIRRSL